MFSYHVKSSVKIIQTLFEAFSNITVYTILKQQQENQAAYFSHQINSFVCDLSFVYI